MFWAGVWVSFTWHAHQYFAFFSCPENMPFAFALLSRKSHAPLLTSFVFDETFVSSRLQKGVFLSPSFLVFSLSTRQTFKLVFHTNVCRYLPLLSVLSVQCQKAISAPWYTRHLLLFNWCPVSSCHSAAVFVHL